jgi:hypothetical protein
MDAEGYTNGSPTFFRLAGEVERLLRDSAHKLLAGNADEVGRLIVAQLAHVHRLTPPADPGEMPEAEYEYGIEHGAACQGFKVERGCPTEEDARKETRRYEEVFPRMFCQCEWHRPVRRRVGAWEPIPEGPSSGIDLSGRAEVSA